MSCRVVLVGFAFPASGDFGVFPAHPPSVVGILTYIAQRGRAVFAVTSVGFRVLSDVRALGAHVRAVLANFCFALGTPRVAAHPLVVDRDTLGFEHFVCFATPFARDYGVPFGGCPNHGHGC